jgi:cytochrome c peroxidase
MKKVVITSSQLLALALVVPLQAQAQTVVDSKHGHGNGLKHAEKNLQVIVNKLSLQSVPTEALNLPSVNDPKVQLGKQLFFTKNLGGEQSAACVSCHHPMLGGGDDLTLPVGVKAVNEFNDDSHDLLGHGRFNGHDDNDLPAVPRNSPTVFNLGLSERSMFWDSRVEFNADGDIVTPDSPVDAQGNRLADQNFPAGTTLAAAQARFPVTSGEEMRGDFAAGMSNEALRTTLTNRLNNSDPAFASQWPAAFEAVYGDSNVTFDRVADAIGDYERSMVFVNNPWQAYVEGDSSALTASQKAGAVLFFTPTDEGGAGCAGCHQGPTFAGVDHHLVAFPQVGPGKGNASGTSTGTDFGRENVTSDAGDRFHFRPPSLLNIEVTGPYGHGGAYQSLEQVVAHYTDPRKSINKLFKGPHGSAPFCQLTQLIDITQKNGQSCESLYPNAHANSLEVVTHLEQARAGQVAANGPLLANAKLNKKEVLWVADFLRALTDPCVKSRSCLNPWIVDGDDQADFPDDQPLVAVDKFGAEL